MSAYVLDWETFYDSKQSYTLKKMTTEEYINDPRFHAFGFALYQGDGLCVWVPEEKIRPMLEHLRLEEHTVVMHNAQFDAAILSWKYGIKPGFIVDTLAMARGLLGNEESLSLDALAERFELGHKGHAIHDMDGVRNPSAVMKMQLADYAKNDALLTWKLYQKLREGFPKVERVIIDITTRMFSEPSFVLDKTPILREIELGEKRKQTLLEQADCELEDLRSDPKFATLLKSLGVEPPQKISVKKTEKAQKLDPSAPVVYTWAFAKSDADFKALAEHEDEMVRWAVEARLGLKSTIKASRSQRFLSIAERMGVMPVALTYYGAATGRYSASSSAKVNMQNLPAVRGSKDPDAGLLRKSLRAPDGHVVVVADASQIEARIVAWLAGQADVIEAFAQGRDVYSEMATTIFSRHVDRKKNPNDYVFGFIGKCVTLGCGYGLGHIKFASMIYAGMLGGPSVLFDAAMAATLGADVDEYYYYVNKYPDMLERLMELKPTAVDTDTWLLHAACAKVIIDKFRSDKKMIPELWRQGDELLEAMFTGSGEKINIFTTKKDALMLPNGMWLHFKELQRSEDGFTCMRRKEGRVKRVKVYGGSVIENVSQALAGVYVKEAMVRAALRGYRPILQVHDEIVVIAPRENADTALRELIECMRIVPKWAPGLPLAAEGDWAESYGEAK